MPDMTDRYGLALLASGQAQKEITHNMALLRVDALLHAAVESRSLSAPPGSPVAGQCWLVPAGATGLWTGQDGRIAHWQEGGWDYIAPAEGCLLWVKPEGVFARLTAYGWNVGDWAANALVVGGDKVVGGRGAAVAAPSGGAVVDAEARAAIDALLDRLRTHGLIAV